MERSETPASGRKPPANSYPRFLMPPRRLLDSTKLIDSGKKEEVDRLMWRCGDG